MADAKFMGTEISLLTKNLLQLTGDAPTLGTTTLPDGNEPRELVTHLNSKLSQPLAELNLLLVLRVKPIKELTQTAIL